MSFILLFVTFAKAEGNGNFSDDFEDGNISDWNLTTVENNWSVVTTDPYAGTYHAQANPQNTNEPASVMEINANTSGYENIFFSYYRKLIGLDIADEFKAKWYDGASWIVVEETLSNSVNDASYVFMNFNLPSTADDNPLLKIRFECTAGAVSEYCRVDNVRVNGSIILGDTIPPIINSILESSDPVFLQNSIKISANVTDDVGVDSVLIEINNVNYSMIQQSAAGSAKTILFKEGFETGSLNSNDWVTNGTVLWGVSSFDPLFGSNYHAQVQQTGVSDPSYLEINISTLGYENITFSYYKKLISLDAADDFAVDWYNGTDWVVLEQLGAGIEDDASYVYQTFNLTNDSYDNSNFKIRFMCEVGAVSEYCRIDNVSISGIQTSSSTEIWGYEFTPNVLGIYNYTIYANDTSNNNATLVYGNFTVIESNITVSEVVQDSSGNSLNVTIEIEDDNNITIYNQTLISHNIGLAKGKYKIKIKPKNHKIKQIAFNEINFSHDINSIVDIDDPADNKGYNELVSLNPILKNSTENDTITVTMTAANVSRNKILYKCADWDFNNQNCTGNWTAWMAISPGQEYSATFYFGDPGLAEGNGTFFEGFESGSLDTNNWTKSGALDWAINNQKTHRLSGVKYIKSENTGVEDIIETNISTENYSNVVFNFYYKTIDMGAGDYIAADYYNGTDWIEVLNSQGTTVYTLDSNNLGSDANNNPNFRIRFRCKNNAGSEACYVDNVEINGDEIMDISPPDISIVYPSNNLNTSDIEIDINYSVGSDAQSCWYSNDTMSLNTSITCGNNITNMVWSEGKHNVSIWVNDSIGNENSSSVSFTIDSLSPYFVDNTPQDQTLTYGVALSYDINATDSREFGCFSVNNSKFSINCNGLLQNVVSLSAGLYYLNITINDSINNINSSVILINITKANPSGNMQIIITPSNNVSQGTQTTSTGSETNTGDADLIYIFYRDGVAVSNPNVVSLGIGTYNYNYNTTGGENYTLGSVNATLIVSSGPDMIGPAITIYSPQAIAYSSGLNLSLNYSVIDSSGVDSCWYNIDFGNNVSLANCANSTFNVSGNGNYILNLFSNDSLGNSANKSVSFSVDSTAISLLLSEPSGTKSSRISIPITYNVFGNNLTCWYNVKTSVGGDVISNTSLSNCSDSSFDVANDGNFVFNLFVNNSFGSYNSTNSSFSVDTSTPAPSPSSGSGGGSGGIGVLKPFNRTGELKVDFNERKNIVIKRGTITTTEIEVTNNEEIFLNDCKLGTFGAIRGWFSNGQVKGLSSGEKFKYILNIKIPEDAEPDTYSTEIKIECDEGNKSSNLVLGVFRNNFETKVENYEKTVGSLKVFYSMKEFAQEKHKIILKYGLLNFEGIYIVKGEESFELGAGEEKENLLEFKIPKDLTGDFKLEMILDDGKTSNELMQEVLLQTKGILGLAISDSNAKTLSTFGIVVVSAIAVFFAFWYSYNLYKKLRLRRIVNKAYEKGVHGRRLIKLDLKHK